MCFGIRPGERLHEVLLSPNESISDREPAHGLRAIQTTRDTASLTLTELPRIVDQLRRRDEAGDRDGLARVCLEAAEALQ